MTTTTLHYSCAECLRNWKAEIPDTMLDTLTQCECGEYAGGRTEWLQLLWEATPPNRR